MEIRWGHSRQARLRRGARLIMAGSIVCCAAACAQQNQRARDFDHFADSQTETSIAALSPQARTAVQYLKSLMIPAGDKWRMADGEIPGAEAPSFDDSHFTPVTDQNRHPEQAITLRQWIDLPKLRNGYDFTGSTVWMRLDIRSWGSPDGVTLWVNGRQVGQSDGVEPIVVRNFMQPGERALLTVKCGRSENDKNLNAVELHVEAPPEKLDPADLYTEYAVAAVLAPSLADPAITAALERSTAAIDQQALTQGDQQRFQVSLQRAQAALEPIRGKLQAITLHVTGDSHMDTAWLWPVTETVDAMKRTFATALQMMDDHPGYTFSQSVGQYYEWISEKAPVVNEGIKRRIADGRWELVGGMWAEPDLNMPDGESLVRQLLIGQRTFQSLYGRTTRVGWNPDSFGYNWQLPQIYKKSGVDYFVTQKMSANETNPLPLKLFWWQSPDGSKVLAYFPHGYANNNLRTLRVSNDMRKARTLAAGLPAVMDLYGVGDHGGGPTRAVLDEGLHWMQPKLILPHMEFGTAQQFFTNVEGKLDDRSPVWNYKLMGDKNDGGKATMSGGLPLPEPAPGKVVIPTWRDELYFEHHRGVYTTQATQKRNGRETEELMLDAEKYASLAWLGGKPYPGTELNEAWKKVLINQSHDLSAGSGIAVIYKDAQRDYDQVRWATAEVSSTALNALSSSVDTRVSEGVPVMVFNPLGWPRAGVTRVTVQMPDAAPEGVRVLDEKGAVVPSVVESRDDKTHTFSLAVATGRLPAMGYEILHVASGPGEAKDADVQVHGLTVENANLSVTVDPSTGCITSLFHKHAKFEALAKGACGNELQTFKDNPERDDAWNIDPGTLDHAEAIRSTESVKLIEQTPVRAVVRIQRKWGHSHFTQDVVLWSGAEQVDIVNDIDWHESHVLLKAAFPLAATSSMATYEIPFGTIDRPTTRTNSWDEAKFEVPALRWADLGDGQHGFSVLNEAKYGYDAKDNVLRLTLLRSPEWPDPGADKGHQHFTFALYPHAGDWRAAHTVERGYEYNYGLKAMQVQPHSGVMPKEHSFASLEGGHVVLTAMKKAEDANAIVFRFYEYAGRGGQVTLHVPAGAQSARMTNLMEKPEGKALPLSKGSEVTVESHPYSIETVQVDYAPNSASSSLP